jgi:exonuclease SbcD
LRFLHTSDWHLGRSLPQGGSRRQEFESVLDEVVRIADAERVDCVLLSGDVYDHKFASSEADSLLFETLIRLFHLKVRVVVSIGNHDSPERWNAFAPLLAEIGVSVVAEVKRPGDGGMFTISSRDGRESANIACLPFVQERRFVDAVRVFEGNERWPQAYAAGMERLIREMVGGFTKDRVNILMAHLLTDGASLGGGEAEVTIGPQCAIRPAALPVAASYVALGHIHKPQTLKHSGAPARYSGSLLQLDFGEREQQKSVTLVDASHGKALSLREIPLTSGRKLLEVGGTLDFLADRAASYADYWLRVKVHSDRRVLGIADRVREILPNAIQVIQVYPRVDEPSSSPPLSSLRPSEQFAAYYRAEHGSEPPTELLATFAEVHEAVGEGIS